MPFSLKTSIQVDGSAVDSSIDGYIDQHFCQGNNGHEIDGCDYSNVTLDICDADNPDGCALP